MNTELGARYSTRWLRSGCPIRTAPGDSATGTGRSAICSGPCNNAEKKPVSEVCNEAAIQPSLFYTWQRELLAGAHTVFSTRRAPSRENELEAKISRLEARVARKDQIIAEVTEEYVTLKKKLGEA